MAVIRVPKTPRSAYNPQRAPGALLQAQVEHLEWATRPAAERTPDRFQIEMPSTEGEAAARIDELMTRLHQSTVGRKPLAAAGGARQHRRTKKRRAHQSPKTPRRKKR